MYRISILALLIFGVCSSTVASDVDWTWKFGGTYARFGTTATASNGFDASDIQITQPRSVYIGSYHEHGVDSWTGNTGFYSSDIRSPLALAPGQSKTWAFYLWEDPAWNTVLELMWGFSSPSVPAFDRMEYRLTYLRAAEGITGGESVPVGTSILLNEHQQGTWSFPVYRTDDGRTGYMFELTARVVPEPSSLLVLGAGGFGLLGAALRRRIRARA